MSFELFKGSEPKNLRPEIFIRQSGQISLNPDAIYALKLGDYDFVQLFFDRENGKIGVLPTNVVQAEGKIELAVCLKSRSGWIDARGFFAHYGITLPQDKAKPVMFETDENGMIVLDYPGK